MNQVAAISLERLGKRFGAQRALDGISLEVAAGQRLALVGHNGSGKSTLVRCLLGLHDFDGGVRIFGHDPRKERAVVLPHVAFVPQTAPALRATVAEFLEMTRILCGLPRAAALAELTELGFDVGPHLHKPFARLSGGMKQKLLIGVALARRPALLILDEPTAGLDAASRGRFFARLAALPAATTMVLVSHRVDELAGLVTRLVEMDQGRVTLDDLVAGTRPAAVLTGGAAGDLTRSFHCQLVLAETPRSVAETLADWGFRQEEPGTGRWLGRVAGPDRFRFLATLTRWAGLVERCHLAPETAGGSGGDGARNVEGDAR